MTTQWVCEHNPEDPDHLICESKDPRRHWWINAFIIGGVLWFVFLSGLVLWIILSRGGGVDRYPGAAVSQLQGSSFAPTESVGAADAPNAALPQRQDTYPSDKERESLDYSGQTEPYLEAEAVYFSKEGEQVGRGAWPPRVGEETKIKVFFKLTQGDPISVATEIGSPNIVVTGKLGENMEWTGFAPMGTGLTYEPATRKVRFIPREGNTAVFEVAITPNAQQIGEKHIIVIDDLQTALDKREILSPNIFIRW